MTLKDKVSRVYKTSDEFINAHKGLWSMLGTITYKKNKTSVKIFDNGVHVKTWWKKSDD